MGLIGVVVPTVRRQNFYVEEVRMMKKEEACPMKRRRGRQRGFRFDVR
jgi:hypothetical protein